MEHVDFVFQWFSSVGCTSKNQHRGTSLVVQRLRLCAPNAAGPGSIPGKVTRSRMHAAMKIPRAATKIRHS